VLLLAGPAKADRQSYALAIQQAHSFVREGLSGRSDAAKQALAALVPEVGDSQPEILADLRLAPPDYADADLRLGAVAAALGQPGDVADSTRAKADLHHILTQPRYAGLHAQESPWNRFWNWVLTQLFNLLSRLPLSSLPGWFWWALLGSAALLAAVVALLIARTGWTKAGRALATSQAAPAESSVDRFAEADAAAAKGDYTTALRSLVAGVATAVSGRPYWEKSPLTVRELFRSSGRLEKLRPLLLTFELAVYGFRPVDEAAYQRCLELAQPFRSTAEEPAVAA
jgi:hypothetical protein